MPELVEGMARNAAVGIATALDAVAVLIEEPIGPELEILLDLSSHEFLADADSSDVGEHDHRATEKGTEQ
jgi:acetaldehyde dehydrogenase (acetylating)